MAGFLSGQTSNANNTNANSLYNELVVSGITDGNTLTSFLKRRVISSSIGNNHLFYNPAADNNNGAAISNANNGFNTVLTFVAIELVKAAIENSDVSIDGSNSKITKLEPNFGTTIADNIKIDGNIISSIDTNGNIALTPNGTGEVDISKVDIAGGEIDGTTIGANAAAAGTFTEANIDNIKIDGNIISSTDTNGNIALTPNGTGEVDISKVDIAGGEIDGTTIGANAAAAGTFTEANIDNIKIDGNIISSTDTNGNIALTPNGTGEVDISKVDIAGGEIDGTTIGANAAAAGTFTEANIDNIKIDGNIISSTDTNGNIALTPNGTGEVDISKVDIDGGEIDGTIIGANSAAAGTFTEANIDNIKIDGNTISSTDANGNIVLAPNGTGEVKIDNAKIATEEYVQTYVKGLTIKSPARAATTSDLSATYNSTGKTLTADSNGAISIDGVTLSQNDRVLVKDQTTKTQNGIYKVSTVGDGSTAFVLTRTDDFNSSTNVLPGSFVFIKEGTLNPDIGYVLTTDNTNGTITLDTDNLEFSQFTSSNNVSGSSISTSVTRDGNVEETSDPTTLQNNLKDIYAKLKTISTFLVNISNDIEFSGGAFNALDFTAT
jgi:hypothetical protein